MPTPPKMPATLAAPPVNKSRNTMLIIGGVVVTGLAVFWLEKKKSNAIGANANQTPTSQEPIIMAQPSNADTLSGEFLSGATSIIGQGAPLDAQPTGGGTNTFPQGGGMPAGFNPGGVNVPAPASGTNTFSGSSGYAPGGGGMPLILASGSSLGATASPTGIGAV
jgi:hypothetical protein